jgi:hypothetical protein|tara:strand:- start:340 stop:513 length:174 start_codon:yes stop_codon:yes gene_type:complete
MSGKKNPGRLNIKYRSKMKRHRNFKLKNVLKLRAGCFDRRDVAMVMGKKCKKGCEKG